MPMRFLFRSLFSLIFCVVGNCHAVAGLFFDVTATGIPDTLNIILALDGNGPLSRQNYTIEGLHLTVTSTTPNHTYSSAGIKLLNAPGYTLQEIEPNDDGYYLFSVSDTAPTHLTILPPTTNPPWYASIEAFEHFDSGRSHVFSKARFGGSYSGNNTVDILESPHLNYPSAYNMSYYNPAYAFIYGGGYGDVTGSIGAFVARVDPTTLEHIWHRQLIDTQANGEWDYPGSLGILHDGFIYVSYGYRLAKIDSDGTIIDTLVL